MKENEDEGESEKRGIEGGREQRMVEVTHSKVNKILLDH